tara:strand:+ start:38 stop:463 length:426 start_codon:yes stop_codon:yes gene_type:complete
MKDYDKVLRVVSKAMIPFIIVFALYVQFHGDYGPGGGFQAGVILAAGLIFYSLIYGLKITKQLVPPRVIEVLMAFGVMLFTSVGLLGQLMGSNFLDYSVLSQYPVKGQHYGIFLVEIGVGITVFAVMLTIFYMFVGRNRDD